jgi:hypothetical protein
MKRFTLAALWAVFLCGAPALAQTYHDLNGTIVPGSVPLPYPYTPLSPGQHTLSITSATALTVPAGARFANVCATTAAVRYTTDGTTTPTATVGQPLAAAACVSLSGPLMIANFRAISATGTLDVEYFQ